jgi:hypothetical protein
MTKAANRYDAIIEYVFFSGYEAGDSRVRFARSDMEVASDELQIKLPKNIGDIIYSFRFRHDLPSAILEVAPQGKQWVIRGVGIGQYEFAAVGLTRIIPTPGLIVTKIPDATPQLIETNALGDEQALLAKVRYNRLVDIFLGITSYSLQNHLRTTVRGIGQVEVDEVYVGVNSFGAQFIVPAQAKGGTDQIGIVQTEQDLAVCRDKFPRLLPRPVAAQFMSDDVIALFELTVQDDEIVLVQEAHYKLVQSQEITETDLATYSTRASSSA